MAAVGFLHGMPKHFLSQHRGGELQLAQDGAEEWGEG